MTEKRPFWSSIQGVITAVAAMISAIAGLLVILHQVGFIGSTADNQNQITLHSMEPGIYLKKNYKKGDRLASDGITVVKEYQLKSDKYNDRVQNINDILNACLSRDISTNTPLTWFHIGYCE